MGTRHRVHGETKRKRHLYLTDTSHRHLVALAQGSGSSPSEICEQIIRLHATALAIPVTSAHAPHDTDQSPSD